MCFDKSSILPLNIMSSDSEDLDALKSQLLSNKSINFNTKSLSQQKIFEPRIITIAKSSEISDNSNFDSDSSNENDSDSSKSNTQSVSTNLSANKPLHISNETTHNSENNSSSEAESDDFDTLKNQLISNKNSSRINNNSGKIGIEINSGKIASLIHFII